MSTGSREGNASILEHDPEKLKPASDKIMLNQRMSYGV